jgi:hypothetical protein
MSRAVPSRKASQNTPKFRTSDTTSAATVPPAPVRRWPLLRLRCLGGRVTTLMAQEGTLPGPGAYRLSPTSSGRRQP